MSEFELPEDLDEIFVASSWLDGNSSVSLSSRKRGRVQLSDTESESRATSLSKDSTEDLELGVSSEEKPTDAEDEFSSAYDSGTVASSKSSVGVVAAQGGRESRRALSGRLAPRNVSERKAVLAPVAPFDKEKTNYNEKVAGVTPFKFMPRRERQQAHLAAQFTNNRSATKLRQWEEEPDAGEKSEDELKFAGAGDKKGGSSGASSSRVLPKRSGKKVEVKPVEKQIVDDSPTPRKLEELVPLHKGDSSGNYFESVRYGGVKFTVGDWVDVRVGGRENHTNETGAATSMPPSKNRGKRRRGKDTVGNGGGEIDHVSGDWLCPARLLSIFLPPDSTKAGLTARVLWCYTPGETSHPPFQTLPREVFLSRHVDTIEFAAIERRARMLRCVVHACGSAGENAMIETKFTPPLMLITRTRDTKSL